MRAGSAPTRCGRFAAHASEMIFVQYMPIKMPDTPLCVPRHLECFYPLLGPAVHDDHFGKYIYLTAKHLYVEEDRCFNRPGWHIDGFGTDDINYIWTDRGPTEFCEQHFELSDDCDESMAQMETGARPENICTYGAHELLRLDNKVVHRAPMSISAGMRTFVKISISRDRYNLYGNAHNYLLNYDWPMVPREEKRNHPSRIPA